MARDPRKVSDPLIDEVRERRRQLWAKYDNDINKVYEAIKRFQQQHPEKLVDPRKARKSVPKE